MAVLHMTSLLLKNSRFLLVFHSKLEEDFLYMAYADIMAKSCHDEEDDDGEEEVKSFEVTGSQRSKEKEMEKQKLLYQQARLHDRGAAEMVLQTISASKGEARCSPQTPLCPRSTLI